MITGKFCAPSDRPTKVFLSQSMNGRTEKEILEERVKYKEAITEMNKREFGPWLEIEFIGWIDENPPEDIPNKAVWYLAKSLEFLSQADVAYFLPGWESARGCIMEHEVCKAYGIPTMIWDVPDEKSKVL